MQRKTPIPVWPYVGIVVCLFVLSVLAVQAWRSLGPNTDSSDQNVVASNRADSFPEPNDDTLPPPRYRATISADRNAQSSPETTFEKRSLVEPETETETEVIEIPASEIDTSITTTSLPDQAGSATHESSPFPPTNSLASTESQLAGDATPSAETPARPAPKAPPATIGSPQSEHKPSRLEFSGTLPIGPPALNAEPDTVSPSETVASVPATTEVASAVPPVPAPTPTPWPKPVALISMLEGLSEEPCRRWAEHALSELQILQNVSSLASSEATSALEGLRMLEEMAAAALKSAGPIPQRLELTSAHYALQRRLDIWQPIHELVRQRDGSQPTMNPNIRDLYISHCVVKRLRKLRPNQ